MFFLWLNHVFDKPWSKAALVFLPKRNSYSKLMWLMLQLRQQLEQAGMSAAQLAEVQQQLDDTQQKLNKSLHDTEQLQTRFAEMEQVGCGCPGDSYACKFLE